MRESAGLLDISTDKGFARLHWRVLVGLLTIAAIVATVLIVMIVTSPGQTSYRDGYSVGRSAGALVQPTHATTVSTQRTFRVETTRTNGWPGALPAEQLREQRHSTRNDGILTTFGWMALLPGSGW